MAATVIPVLFLALTLSDPGWVKLRSWAFVWEKVQPIRPDSFSRAWWWLQIRKQGTFLLSAVLTIVELLGVGGELAAVVALDHQHATKFEHQIATEAVVVLVVVVALSILVRVMVQPVRLPSQQSSSED